MTSPRRTLIALLLTASLVACSKDPGGAVDPYPAPDFTLPDFNPRSSTWNAELGPSDALGEVLVLYFASFG